MPTIRETWYLLVMPEALLLYFSNENVTFSRKENVFYIINATNYICGQNI